MPEARSAGSDIAMAWQEPTRRGTRPDGGVLVLASLEEGQRKSAKSLLADLSTRRRLFRGTGTRSYASSDATITVSPG